MAHDSLWKSCTPTANFASNAFCQEGWDLETLSDEQCSLKWKGTSFFAGISACYTEWSHIINWINNGIELLVCRTFMFTMLAFDVRPCSTINSYYRKSSVFSKRVRNTVLLAILSSIESVMLRLDRILLCHQMHRVSPTLFSVA